jgi:hypothetical protein
MTHIIYANISRQEYLEFLSEFEFGNIVTGYVFQLVVYENSHSMGLRRCSFRSGYPIVSDLGHSAGYHALQYLEFQKSMFSDDTR